MKNSTLTFSLFFSLVLLVSCNKDGAMGEVNFGKLEGKTWVADRTAFLLNGQETGSVPHCYMIGDIISDIDKVYFSNGNVTVNYVNPSFSPTIAPYSLIDGVINISILIRSFSLTPMTISNNDFIADERNEYYYVFDEPDKYGQIRKIEQELVPPVPIANVNGCTIYHAVYLVDFSRVNNDSHSTDVFSCIYYLDNNQRRVGCTFEPFVYEQMKTFFHSLDLSSLTKDELLLAIKGVKNASLINGRHGRNEFEELSTLSKDELLSYFQKEIRSFPSEEGYYKDSWELCKLYAEKCEGAYWCDRVARHYFSAK